MNKMTNTQNSPFKLGDKVSFKDESGKQREGIVVNLEPAGKRENGVGINVDGEIGCYIRKDQEVKKVA